MLTRTASFSPEIPHVVDQERGEDTRRDGPRRMAAAFRRRAARVVDDHRCGDEIYRRNREMIAALGRQPEIPIYFFLQPVRFFPSKDDAKLSPLELKKQQVYRSLANEAASGTVAGFHTLHAALDTVPKYYVDWAHTVIPPAVNSPMPSARC